MKCPSCGANAHESWRHCASCGAPLSTGTESIRPESLIEHMLSKFKDEFMGTESFFERDFEAFDLGRSQKPKSRGFSIRIVSGSGKEPKVSIQTFGDVNRDDVRKQVSSYLGVQPKQPARQHPEQQPKDGGARIVEETEEPKTDIKYSGSSLTVSMKLPGVKSEDDIAIQELGSSIEVKAYAGRKAYFKILKKPDNFRIVRKSFSDERLDLTLE